MKTKFFLFVSLVLLAVQGRAAPDDFLETHSTRLDYFQHWDKFEHSNSLIPSDGFVFPGFNPNEYEVNGVVSTLIGVFGWCNTYLDEYLYFDILGQRTEATVGVLTQVNLNVVLGRIRYPTEVELIDTTGVFQELSTNMIWPDQVPQRISLLVYPKVPGVYKAWLKFSGNKVNKYVTLYCDAIGRSITVQPNTSFNAFDIALGDTVSKTYVVKGQNLSSHMMVELNDTTGMYSIDRTEYDLDEAQNGSLLKVTYSPTAEGTHDAYIRIYDANFDWVVNKTITLHCSAKDRRISVTKEQLSFEEQPIGGSDSQTFYVYSVNLNENLTLSSNNSYFSVSPKTITPEEATHLAPVTVTYKPTSVGVHNGKLTISGGGADSVSVGLTGSCVAMADPTITVDPSTYDFGTVKEGTTNTAIFTVTGTGLSERISIIWPQEDGFTISPTDLPPTGGKVTVTFKPTSGGNYSQQYTLSSGNTSAKITVTGKCAAATTNKSNLYFGTVAKGETKTQKFKVTGVNLTHDLTLTSSNSSVFVVSPSTITAAQAKAGKEVTVTYKPNTYVDHSGTITISGQDIKSKSVSLSGKCAKITVSPASYDFGTCTKGKTYTKTFTVTGTNVGERISVVTQYEEEFSVSPTDLPAAGGTVTVTFKPSSTGSSYSYTFSVSGGGITTPVSVTGKSGTPYISVNPSSLHFTTASSQTLTVTGFYLTGNITLKSNQAPFTVSPTTLPPSGGTVTVTCNANNFLNSATGSITIKSDGATTRTVPLTYTAGPGPLEIYSVKPYDEQENIINSGELEISTIGLGGICSDMDDLSMAFKVYAEGLSIIIESPVQQKALISDIAGHVREVDLQTGRNEVPVNSSGIYFVRIREKSTKLMLK